MFRGVEGLGQLSSLGKAEGCNKKDADMLEWEDSIKRSTQERTEHFF